jgi:hypothetical protein
MGNIMDGTTNTVVMVGIQSMRRLHWFVPQDLNGREPTVFNLIVNPQGCYVPTGPYCLISFKVRQEKAPESCSLGRLRTAYYSGSTF